MLSFKHFAFCSLGWYKLAAAKHKVDKTHILRYILHDLTILAFKVISTHQPS